MLRSALRRTTPFAVRWRIRYFRRLLVDRLQGVHFTNHAQRPDEYPHVACMYARPLISYAGQEHLFAAKRANNDLVLRAIDGVVVRPGEMFSFWRCVGRPTTGRGFANAAAIRGGELTKDIGGAICLASTLVFNLGLLAGMTIVERHCHSIDSYGDARYFELGRDAAVEFAYRDLRFRNDLPVPVLLSVRTEADAIVGAVRSASPLLLRVAVEVVRLDAPSGGILTRTTRSVESDSRSWTDDVGFSEYSSGHARLSGQALLGSTDSAMERTPTTEYRQLATGDTDERTGR